MSGSTALNPARSDRLAPLPDAKPRMRAKRDARTWVVEPTVAARDRLLALSEVVPAMALALGPRAEVVLHDLSRTPNSIVALGGSLTQRAVGGPMTDLMLRRIRRHQTADLPRYRVTHGDRIFQASTIFLRHPDGTPYGCLCINIDVTDLVRAQALTENFIGFFDGDAGVAAGRGGDPVGTVHGERRPLLQSGEETASDSEETYPQTVNELAESVVDRSVRRIGIPVPLMRKEHKLEVVRAAEGSGLFLMRAAAESLAQRLQVSRYTIYNYLAEIKRRSNDATEADGS